MFCSKNHKFYVNRLRYTYIFYCSKNKEIGLQNLQTIIIVSVSTFQMAFPTKFILSVKISIQKLCMVLASKSQKLKGDTRGLLVCCWESLKDCILQISTLYYFFSTLTQKSSKIAVLTSSIPKLHFEGLAVNPAFLRHSRTSRTCSKCSSHVSLNMMMSASISAAANFSVPCQMLSIILWKVAGAPWSPNGIVVNSYNPVGVVNAVFFLDSSERGTCQ